MRKAIVGVAAVGTLFALRQVMGRIAREMREHCEQMMAEFGGRGEGLSGT